MLCKCGEQAMKKGTTRQVAVPVPPKGAVRMKRKEALVDTDRNIIGSGRAELNDVDWGYVL